MSCACLQPYEPLLDLFCSIGNPSQIYILSVNIDVNILQVLLRYVIGQLFLGFFVSLVFSKRYITPSDSHFEAFSGISTMCDISDASLECLFSRTCSHKLGIVYSRRLLFVFFADFSPVLLLVILIHVFCMFYPLLSFIESFFFTLHLTSVSRTSRHLQWWLFPSPLLYKTSLHYF